MTPVRIRSKVLFPAPFAPINTIYTLEKWVCVREGVRGCVCACVKFVRLCIQPMRPPTRLTFALGGIKQLSPTIFGVPGSYENERFLMFTTIFSEAAGGGYECVGVCVWVGWWARGCG